MTATMTADLPPTIDDRGRPTCSGPSKYWELVERMDGFALQPIKNMAISAVGVGGAITLSTLGVVYFFELPWLVAVFGLFSGVVAVGLIYALLKREINRGPYVVFHAYRDQVELPRYGILVPRSACDGLLIRFTKRRTPDGDRTVAELVVCLDSPDLSGGYVTVASQIHDDIRSLALEMAQRLRVSTFEDSANG